MFFDLLQSFPRLAGRTISSVLYLAICVYCRVLKGEGQTEGGLGQGSGLDKDQDRKDRIDTNNRSTPQQL